MTRTLTGVDSPIIEIKKVEQTYLLSQGGVSIFLVIHGDGRVVIRPNDGGRKDFIFDSKFTDVRSVVWGTVVELIDKALEVARKV